jgi:NADH-quinone oxidoreductase subunit N
VFQAAIAAGETPLVIVGVLASAIAAFFYVRIIVLMFFSDPLPDGPVVAVPTVFTGTAVGVGVAATLVFGIVPEPVLSLASQAANHLFVS